MNYSEYRILLDVHSIGSQTVLSCKQNDTARRIYITLTEGPNIYPIARGCTAIFAAEKPDGNVLYNACRMEGNTIVYAFTEQTATVPGRTDCEIRLFGPEGDLLVSPAFGLLVGEAAVDDGHAVQSAFESDVLTGMIRGLVSERVEQYLAETGLAVDNSLTEAGAAADAQAVGEAIRGVFHIGSAVPPRRPALWLDTGGTEA